MVSITRSQRELFDSLASEFLGTYPVGRTIIAVDGAKGTRRFANGLAKRLGKGNHAVFRASIDRFYRPRAQRLVLGADDDTTHYENSFDYALMRRVLIEPFHLGGSAGFVTSAFDAQRDVPKIMKFKTGPQDATLIIDGEYLNRPELRELWSFTIWLESDWDLSVGQRAYRAECDPRVDADVTIDNSDAEHPTQVL